MIETLNAWAQLALTACGIVAAAVAALQGTRWGRHRALQAAREALEVAQAVARAAVQATEQEHRHAPVPATPEQKRVLRRQKAERALGRFYQLLPAGVAVPPDEAEALIERAVHEMNAGARRVDP